MPSIDCCGSHVKNRRESPLCGEHLASNPHRKESAGKSLFLGCRSRDQAHVDVTSIGFSESSHPAEPVPSTASASASTQTSTDKHEGETGISVTRSQVQGGLPSFQRKLPQRPGPQQILQKLVLVHDEMHWPRLNDFSGIASLRAGGRLCRVPAFA